MSLKKFLHFFILPFPSIFKVFIYKNIFGYEIESGVKIGFSILMVEKCTIRRNSRVGHFNFIAKIKNLDLGCDVKIGHFNILLGGNSVELGDGVVIGRFNEINSIIDPLSATKADPRLIVGRFSVITAWHKIDYTDCVKLGESVVLAGRNSCIWTHNRQQVKPVEIGQNCYMGSGIQMAPGSKVGPYCVIGLGSVITKAFTANYSLLAGVPARIIKPLDEESRIMVEFPTRVDLNIVADEKIYFK